MPATRHPFPSSMKLQNDPKRKKYILNYWTLMLKGISPSFGPGKRQE